MTREAKRGAGQDEEEEEDGLSERVQINRSIQSWCPLTRLVTAGDVLLNCLRQSLKGCRECVSRVYNSVVHTIHDVVRLTFCPPPGGNQNFGNKLRVRAVLMRYIIFYAGLEPNPGLIPPRKGK